MSTVDRFSTMFLPPSEGKQYVDALAQALIDSPEWIADDIENLEAEIDVMAAELAGKRSELVSLRAKLAGLAVTR